jgi:hypothetical protein
MNLQPPAPPQQQTEAANIPLNPNELGEQQQTQEKQPIENPEPLYSVDVSIEPNHECEVVEIKYDGQEIYKE